MSDDIVKRLNNLDGNETQWSNVWEIAEDAADELTRLRARLAPVDDDKLVETVARAICLNRASHACNCKENGVCKAPVKNLREYNEIWPQARAAIAAAIRSRGSE